MAEQALWTLYDRDWNEDGGHEDAPLSECMVWSFPAAAGEGPAQALSRWCKSVDDEEAAGFDRCDAHHGYELIGADADLHPGELVVKFLRSEEHPDFPGGARKLRPMSSVYSVQTKDGTFEVSLDPWNEVMQEVAHGR